jgi:hypothetical protein
MSGSFVRPCGLLGGPTLPLSLLTNSHALSVGSTSQLSTMNSPISNPNSNALELSQIMKLLHTLAVHSTSDYVAVGNTQTPYPLWIAESWRLLRWAEPTSSLFFALAA